MQFDEYFYAKLMSWILQCSNSYFETVVIPSLSISPSLLLALFFPSLPFLFFLFPSLFLSHSFLFLSSLFPSISSITFQTFFSFLTTNMKFQTSLIVKVTPITFLFIFSCSMNTEGLADKGKMSWFIHSIQHSWWISILWAKSCWGCHIWSSKGKQWLLLLSSQFSQRLLKSIIEIDSFMLNVLPSKLGKPNFV